MQHDLLLATNNNGIQSPYPDDSVHHPGIFLKQHFPDMTHSNASYTPCYLGQRQLFWLGLCMYTPSQSRQPATLHSDGCHICKQNECLMIQQAHTILVLESKTWKIWFLCRVICLWMHCTVLTDCTEPITFVCAHLDWYSYSPSFQASVECIRRNFGLDREIFVEVFYFSLAQVLPEFHQPSLIHEQFKSNTYIKLFWCVLSRPLVGDQCQYMNLLRIRSSFQFLPHAVVLTLLLSTVHHFPQKQSQSCPVQPCSHHTLQQWCFYTCQQLFQFLLGACNTTVLCYAM